MKPLVFHPLPMERVWGGSRIGTLPGRTLPEGKRIGESWEIVDREDAQSVVADGPLAGMTLHSLWMEERRAIFGEVADAPRFPLLAKILDASETLSVQVHPPAALAAALRGEPKTEMWYLLDAEPGSLLYAGFCKGVTRERFEEALNQGEAAALLHSIPVQRGDCIFIPSGRCHAIGAGCLIIEMQQNSDTTYRVWDWGRMGLDGKPRALHREESMHSIDFSDQTPMLAVADGPTLVSCEHFHVEKWTWAGKRDVPSGCSIFTIVEGRVRCGESIFSLGSFFLLPACADDRQLETVSGPASVLRTTLP